MMSKNAPFPAKAGTGPQDCYQTYGITDANLPVFYQQLKQKLTFPLSWVSGNFTDFEAWRRTARAKVLELTFQPPDQTPFEPEIIATEDRGTHTVKKVVFNLTAESRVLGLMGIPKGPGPFPAILLLHDHGARFDIGKEKLIRPWSNDKAKLAVAQSWAKRYFSGYFIGDELAARGYVVIATDALGWSDRGVLTEEAQQALGSNLLNLGTSPTGLMIAEDIRAADFLATRAEVDPLRIGAVGFSMGAHRVWQIAALSDTVQAGVAVCWMGTLDGFMRPEHKTVRGYSAFQKILPGVANFLDCADIASIAAPKPMLFYNGESDSGFPVGPVKDAYAKMRHVWDSQQADHQLVTKIWPGLGHEFVRKQQTEAFAWLDQWLRS
jgi:dienelactone hydrolase